MALLILLLASIAQAQTCPKGTTLLGTFISQQPVVTYMNSNNYAVSVYFVGYGADNSTVLFIRLASDDPAMSVIDPVPVTKKTTEKYWLKDLGQIKLYFYYVVGNDTKVCCVGCQ